MIYLFGQCKNNIQLWIYFQQKYVGQKCYFFHAKEVFRTFHAFQLFPASYHLCLSLWSAQDEEAVVFLYTFCAKTKSLKQGLAIDVA